MLTGDAYVSAHRHVKQWLVGRAPLHFDAASYSCTGDAEANKMFTRNYRKPYVVPW